MPVRTQRKSLFDNIHRYKQLLPHQLERLGPLSKGEPCLTFSLAKSLMLNRQGLRIWVRNLTQKETTRP